MYKKAALGMYCEDSAAAGENEKQGGHFAEYISDKRLHLLEQRRSLRYYYKYISCAYVL